MTIVRGGDWPPTVSDADYTEQLNLTSAAYVTGNPEVGHTFVAPTSGRVEITVGGGARDNTNDNRVFLSAQVFHGTDATGSEVLVPSVTTNGWGQAGVAANYSYGSRTFLLENLLPGEVYYARVMISAEQTTGSTADVSAREILIEPAP